MRTKTKFYIVLIIFLLLLISALLVCFHIERHFFPAEHRVIVKKYAGENDLDPLLVAAIIYRESRFDKDAVSRSSARGLMQIMPATGEDIARRLQADNYLIEDLFDPDTNLRFGCYYMAKMKKEFDYDITLALAAYNSGPENVKNWLNKEGNTSDNLTEEYPFTETRNYVTNVRKIYWILRFCNKFINI